MSLVFSGRDESILVGNPTAYSYKIGQDQLGRDRYTTHAVVTTSNGDVIRFAKSGKATNLTAASSGEHPVYGDPAVVNTGSKVYVYGADQQGNLIELQYDHDNMDDVQLSKVTIEGQARDTMVFQSVNAAAGVRDGQRFVYATDGHSQLVQVIVSGNESPDGAATNVTREIIDAGTAYGYYDYQKPYAARTYSDLVVFEDDNRHFVYGSNGGDLILFIGDIESGTWQASNLTQDTMSIYGDPDQDGRRPIRAAGGVEVVQGRTPANDSFGSPGGYRLANGDRHIFKITGQGEVVEYYIQFDVDDSTRTMAAIPFAKRESSNGIEPN